MFSMINNKKLINPYIFPNKIKLKKFYLRFKRYLINGDKERQRSKKLKNDL